MTKVKINAVNSKVINYKVMGGAITSSKKGGVLSLEGWTALVEVGGIKS